MTSLLNLVVNRHMIVLHSKHAQERNKALIKIIMAYMEHWLTNGSETNG